MTTWYHLPRSVGKLSVPLELVENSLNIIPQSGSHPDLYSNLNHFCPVGIFPDEVQRPLCNLQVRQNGRQLILCDVTILNRAEYLWPVSWQLLLKGMHVLPNICKSHNLVNDNALICRITSLTTFFIDAENGYSSSSGLLSLVSLLLWTSRRRTLAHNHVPVAFKAAIHPFVSSTTCTASRLFNDSPKMAPAFSGTVIVISQHCHWLTANLTLRPARTSAHSHKVIFCRS